MRVTPKFDSVYSFDISKASGVQTSPAIAFGKDNYLAVWADARKGGSLIYAARVSGDGKILEPEGVQIGQGKGTYQSIPAVAFDGKRFLVVWASSSPNAIHGRFVTSDGKPGDTVRIYTTDGSLIGLEVASDQSGFMATWIELGTAYSVKGQTVGPDGKLVGKPVIVTESGQHSGVSICWGGVNYTIAYNSIEGQVRGRKYDAKGQPVSSAFNISSSTGMQSSCDIIAGPKNRYLAVWAETRESQANISGNMDIPINKK